MLPLANIHQMESGLLPTSYSVSELVKNCISIAGLIHVQYAALALAADAHACTLQKEDLGKKKQASKQANRNFCTKLPSVGLAPITIFKAPHESCYANFLIVATKDSDSVLNEREQSNFH